MLKFHLDENVAQAIAIALRARGVDVTTTHEADLKGASDIEQLEHSLQQGRVVVTHDVDLLALHAAGIPHAGIAFCTLRTRTIGQIVLKLSALSRYCEPIQIAGRVEFL